MGSTIRQNGSGYSDVREELANGETGFDDDNRTTSVELRAVICVVRATFRLEIKWTGTKKR